MNNILAEVTFKLRSTTVFAFSNFYLKGPALTFDMYTCHLPPESMIIFLNLCLNASFRLQPFVIPLNALIISDARLLDFSIMMVQSNAS